MLTILILGVLLLLALTIGVAALIGRSFAEDREEDALLWKLAGYGALGCFTFAINHFPLPVGYGIALILASRAEINQSARRAAATTTFVLWVISLLIR
jgi:uncharacterized membrane protein